MPGAYERLLDQFRSRNKVVRTLGPNRALTQCPGARHAHGDRNPSLSIAAGDQCVLLYCMAGCTTQELVDTTWLDWTDFYDDQKGITYTYDDGRKVHRTPTKEFKQYGKKNGHVTQFYRRSKIAEAIDANKTVYLVEGEKDADTILVLTGEVATTAPQGSKNFQYVDGTPLHGARVVAVVDQDVAGIEWAQQVKDKLGEAATLEFRKPKVGKDVSEHLTAGFTLDDLDPYTPPKLSLAGAHTAAWLETQHFDPLEWIVPGLVPEGFSILVGAPKVGKSWMALAIALAAASGGYAFGKIKIESRPVFLLALEDSDRRLQSRMRQLFGDQQLPANLTYLTRLTTYALTTLQDWTEDLPSRSKPLVIIDVIGAIMPPAKHGETTYDRDNKFGSRLRDFAVDHPGMSIIGLHHDRKASSEDFIDAVSGTKGLTGSADTTLLVRRPRKEPTGTISITGRDVEENEYAIKLINGTTWDLDGNDLEDAAANADTKKESGGLKDRSLEILAYVNDQHGHAVTPTEASEALGLEIHMVRTYLARLAQSSRIKKLGRGAYASVNTTVASVASLKNSTHATVEESHTQHSQQQLVSDANFFSQNGLCPKCGEPFDQPGLTKQCAEDHNQHPRSSPS